MPTEAVPNVCSYNLASSERRDEAQEKLLEWEWEWGEVVIWPCSWYSASGAVQRGDGNLVSSKISRLSSLLDNSYLLSKKGNYSYL